MAPTGRHLRPELMDQPGLDPRAHRHALAAIGCAHRVSRSAASMWPAIREIARYSGRPLRILDLACGGGQIVIDLARRCAREGVAGEACGVWPRESPGTFKQKSRIFEPQWSAEMRNERFAEWKAAWKI